MMTAALLALLLTQTGNTEAPPAPETALRSLPMLGAKEEPMPVLRYGAPTECTHLMPTPQAPVLRYRVQCDEATRRCLAAPQKELNADGTESTRTLERVPGCNELPNVSRQRAEAGFVFVPAIAETPPGWYRDERGRVMQFNFDLHRRVWLGGGWTPQWRQGEERALSRGRLDFGIVTETPGWRSRRVHRVTLFDTELVLGEQSSLDATLLRYDTNARPTQPFIRVSTFIGKPRRTDLSLDLGTWLEVLHLEQVRRGGIDTSFLTLVGGQLTLDLWHSVDLSSYVRVRAGPSLEYDRTHSFLTLVPGAALEGDLTLDDNGFHHLTASAETEKILLAKRVDGRPLRPERLRLRAGYEVILLAINDQPVSLVLEGRGQWRDDLGGVPPAWEWSAHTGLRFSLWAPARRSATSMTAR
ncbi:hypothetical protein [Melittangium boletus]|uniref:Uncharacterized protein n=1 Tax=Melittangium boletus DSM 14713 TaxID=1294270 RepID=A0A250I740_9BACT|nr:hypothetical protein [Melittangium boletus]ATB27010.1 hypothetical protein MEBOL_000445 [Melittangium boletus DSM 14713]